MLKLFSNWFRNTTTFTTIQPKFEYILHDRDGQCGRNSPAVGKSTMGDQRSGPSRREDPKDNTALRANERAGLT